MRPTSKESVRASQSRIGFGIVGVFFDRLVEISGRHLESIGGSLIPEEASLEIGLISLRIDHLDAFQLRLFPGTHIDSNLLRDRARHLVLGRQGIAKIPLVTLGP